MTRSELQDLARQVAVSNGLPPEGFVAQIGQESAWNPNAVSPVGAMGLAQFMPATWAEWGTGADPFDPMASLSAGARYMRWVQQWLVSQGLTGSWSESLAAYNWGIGNVRNSWQSYGEGWLVFAPQETRNYVAKIAPYYEAAPLPGVELANETDGQVGKTIPALAIVVVSGLILWGLS